MTENEIAAAISNMTDRLNRIEANVANLKADPHHVSSPALDAIDAALAALIRATETIRNNEAAHLRSATEDSIQVQSPHPAK